jgi:hypothetical protein
MVLATDVDGRTTNDELVGHRSLVVSLLSLVSGLQSLFVGHSSLVIPSADASMWESRTGSETASRRYWRWPVTAVVVRALPIWPISKKLQPGSPNDEGRRSGVAPLSHQLIPFLGIATNDPF